LYLVNTYCAVPLSQATVSLSVLKVLLLATQVIYVAGGVSILASRDLDRMSGRAALLSAGTTAVILCSSFSSLAH
jgi:hypothetical protein